MGAPTGFAFEMRGEDVVITHHGVRATVLRGARAADFLSEVDRGDPQLLMARVTGNYRRGNERMARQHPRNQ
jgi:hypothetical protein